MIISSGDEIIVGQLLDTNAQWIAQRLMDVGVVPLEHVTVPDDQSAAAAAIRGACGIASLVVMSGGLGPTDGDLTRAALAEVLGDALVVDTVALASLHALLKSRGREISARQERQAQRPESATCLPNAYGTAPGLHAVVLGGVGEDATKRGGDGADVFCLPGPPGELRPMFEREVMPRIRRDVSRAVVTRLAHIVGLAEADAVARLGDLTRRDRNPLVGITASSGILTLRMRCEVNPGQSELTARPAEAADSAGAAASLDAAEARARSVLGDHFFASQGEDPAIGGIGWQELVRAVLKLLTSRGEMLSVVESCTGGMLGEFVTSLPGSSAAFIGGWVTYANSMKEMLGVNPQTLRRHGAVSPETAQEMAACGLARSQVNRCCGEQQGPIGVGDGRWCLSITGIAGPDGGTASKPVGTVYIGLAGPSTGTDAGAAAASSEERQAMTSQVEVRRFAFGGDREDIRRRAAVSALSMLYFRLRGGSIGSPRLLWETGIFR